MRTHKSSDIPVHKDTILQHVSWGGNSSSLSSSDSLSEEERGGVGIQDNLSLGPSARSKGEIPPSNCSCDVSSMVELAIILKKLTKERSWKVSSSSSSSTSSSSPSSPASSPSSEAHWPKKKMAASFHRESSGSSHQLFPTFGFGN
ncbi:uncharacterized protein DDB_G0271670-like [Macrobrachium nipponense]|uniref:uncharacterized protein DDB_G0271670-like n=1 Tax=Macrobrachium nipponense TaxID=159736 RepID=UPI0030C7AAFA